MFMPTHEGRSASARSRSTASWERGARDRPQGIDDGAEPVDLLGGDRDGGATPVGERSEARLPREKVSTPCPVTPSAPQ